MRCQDTESVHYLCRIENGLMFNRAWLGFKKNCLGFKIYFLCSHVNLYLSFRHCAIKDMVVSRVLSTVRRPALHPYCIKEITIVMCIRQGTIWYIRWIISHIFAALLERGTVKQSQVN